MEPNSTLEEGYRVTINKREANILLESPRKRLRGACEPTEVTVEDVAAKGSKRKASAETETPSKKQRGGPNVTDTITNTSEPTTVSVVNVRANKNKKEDSAAQLPATETPRTTRSERGCDPSQSSSSPSTSKQENGCTPFSVKTRRGKMRVCVCSAFTISTLCLANLQLALASYFSVPT